MPIYDFIPGHRHLRGLHGAVCWHSLFSSPKPQPQPVVALPASSQAQANQPASAVPAPVIVPTENSTAVAQAQQDEMKSAAARTGRASTILSQNDISKSDSLGD